jgi:hypothetical protein
MGLFLLGVLGGAFAMVKWGGRIRESINRTVTAKDPGRRSRVSAEDIPHTDG